MSVLRWILFLFASLTGIALAQMVGSWLGEAFSGSIYGWVLMGLPILLLTAPAIRIAPKPTVGGAIVLTIFLVLEIVTIVNFWFPGWTRLLVDLMIVAGIAGGVVAARGGGQDALVSG